VADHDEVEASFVGSAHDQLGGVPGQDVDLEIDACFARLVACQPRDRAEELVLLPLHLVDLADRRRARGQFPLDGKRVQLGPRQPRELDGRVEGFLAALTTVDRDEDLLEGHERSPPLKTRSSSPAPSASTR
jgi:hypothetical protein